MDLGLHGRVAMVAAASKGIGFAIAQSLVAEGCRVSICARSRDAVEAAARSLGPNAAGFVCDVSSASNLSEWYDSTNRSFGSPDIVVTNSGGPAAGPFSKMSDADWQAGFETTVMLAVRLSRIAQPAMRERGWGRIVHITSLVAKEPSPVLGISTTLRAGIAALVRLQAQELAPFGITVNSVLPGHTLTDRQLHLAEVIAEQRSISKEEALALQAAKIPVGRLGDPREIADAVTYLCSTKASFVTGVNLLVDGASANVIP